MLFSDPVSDSADIVENDLGPLAWVLDELKKTLDAGVRAQRQFLSAALPQPGRAFSDESLGFLEQARKQFHQGVAALEMVGMGAPAVLLHALESVAQYLIAHPERCTEAVVADAENACLALIEYLNVVLAGKPISPVALFFQYEKIKKFFGPALIAHPADLWPREQRWIDPIITVETPKEHYGSELRARLDTMLLRLVRFEERSEAGAMASVSLGLSQGETSPQAQIFWKISAAFFQAIAQNAIPLDVHVKHTVTCVFVLYLALAKKESPQFDGLRQSMLFYCAQANDHEQSGALHAVRCAYGLTRHTPVDYTRSYFGRFDQTTLTQARKRILAATDTWAALSGGDVKKYKNVLEQFTWVADSLKRLHPESAGLATALLEVIEFAAHSGHPPSPELAMEVATTVLYLQWSFEDLGLESENMTQRSAVLEQRLRSVKLGQDPGILAAWMENLYRQVSDRQTIGSVVEELRASLSQTEKLLDDFFRHMDKRHVLNEVPVLLSQMKGVMSVLGMEQATQAIQHMIHQVESWLAAPESPTDEIVATHTIDQISTSLGALGFLIDMLSYQRVLASKLFVFDQEKQEFRFLRGQERHRISDSNHEHALARRHSAQHNDSLKTQGNFSPIQPSHAAPAQPSSPKSADIEFDQNDQELLDIFLEEVQEVCTNGHETIRILRDDPNNLTEQTALRRVFHTLKGSSRMVGLKEFGEAAWAFEQLHNTWLADQKHAESSLLDLSAQALDQFGLWVSDIADGNHHTWRATPFEQSATALRTEGRIIPLVSQHESLLAPKPSDTSYASDELHTSETSEDPDTPSSLKESSESLVESDDFEPTALFSDFGTLKDAPPLPAERPSLGLESIDFHAPSPSSYPATELVKLEDMKSASHSTDFTPEEEEDSASVQNQQVATTNEHELVALMHEEFAQEIPVQDHQTQEAIAHPNTEATTSMSVHLETVPTDSTIDDAADSVLDTPDAEDVKIVGDLRISTPLYTVYIQEASEWSQHLASEIAAWVTYPTNHVPENAIIWAHSLAGSSATVGFMALSDLARRVEHALHHAQLQPHSISANVHLFTQATSEIRHLLDRFTAGELCHATPEIINALDAFLATEVLTETSKEEIQPEEIKLDAVQPVTPTSVEVVSVMPAPASSMLFDHRENRHEYGSFTPSLNDHLHASVDADVDAMFEDEDEIEVHDSIDPDLFPIFEEEAQELLPRLAKVLRHWYAHPKELNQRQESLRALHTLKGSARLAGALRLGEMVHRLESVIQQMSDDSVSSEALDAVLTRFDQIQTNFEALCHGSQNSTNALIQELPTSQTPVSSFESLSAQSDSIKIEAPDLEAHHTSRGGQSAADSTSAPVTHAPEKIIPVHALSQTARAQASASVRVRSNLLDRLLNQSGEVMMGCSKMESRVTQLRQFLSELGSNLERLRQQLRDVELQAETQMQSRLAQAKDVAAGFDPLEFDRFTRVQELTRMMAESVNDVATLQRAVQRNVEDAEDDLIAQTRQTRDLQRDLLRTRMVQFETVSQRLYSVARQSSKETGKQIRLDILGGSIEMDRSVLDRVTPAFEHLLRNAVAHGIEKPEQRQAAGKDSVGVITIKVAYEGNEVSVEFADDGAGLNLQRIREKALSQGLMHADEEMTEERAAELIFTQGFSTATHLTGLAGRGIGMDVVRTEVGGVGGRIETVTRVNAGTRFKLILPLTTAVTQVVMVRVGSITFGIPAGIVELVRRVDAQGLEQAYVSERLVTGAQSLPFFWAGALILHSPHSTEHTGRTGSVLIVRSATQKIAVHVDEVLGNQEVVVKNLGPQLMRLPGLAGMSVLASGAVVLIYNPVALVMSYGGTAHTYLERIQQSKTSVADPSSLTGASTAHTGHKDPSSSLNPLVLVVDDSITVRRVTQRLLQREGYRVSTATDGLQALELLHQERPVVVLSDIEMPRMDGFDLLRNIRHDTQLSDLPVIMITSRMAEKHRDHAYELGANHYLGKPYGEEELLQLIRQHAMKASSVEVEG